jgi:hypothetical protein
VVVEAGVGVRGLALVALKGRVRIQCFGGFVTGGLRRVGEARVDPPQPWTAV